MSVTSAIFLLFAISLAACGQLMLKHGMTLATSSAKASGDSLAVKAATSPWVVFGLGVFGVSAVAWLATLSRVPLSVAYPFNALGYIGILSASALFLNEKTNVWTWIGTACVAFGLVVVVVTKP